MWLTNDPKPIDGSVEIPSPPSSPPDFSEPLLVTMSANPNAQTDPSAQSDGVLSDGARSDTGARSETPPESEAPHSEDSLPVDDSEGGIPKRSPEEYSQYPKLLTEVTKEQEAALLKAMQQQAALMEPEELIEQPGSSVPPEAPGGIDEPNETAEPDETVQRDEATEPDETAETSGGGPSPTTLSPRDDQAPASRDSQPADDPSETDNPASDHHSPPSETSSSSSHTLLDTPAGETSCSSPEHPDPPKMDEKSAFGDEWRSWGWKERSSAPGSPTTDTNVSQEQFARLYKEAVDKLQDLCYPEPSQSPAPEPVEDKLIGTMTRKQFITMAKWWRIQAIHVDKKWLGPQSDITIDIMENCARAWDLVRRIVTRFDLNTSHDGLEYLEDLTELQKNSKLIAAALRRDMLRSLYITILAFPALDDPAMRRNIVADYKETYWKVIETSGLHALVMDFLGTKYAQQSQDLTWRLSQASAIASTVVDELVKLPDSEVISQRRRIVQLTAEVSVLQSSMMETIAQTQKGQEIPSTGEEGIAATAESNERQHEERRLTQAAAVGSRTERQLEKLTGVKAEPPAEPTDESQLIRSAERLRAKMAALKANEPGDAEEPTTAVKSPKGAGLSVQLMDMAPPLMQWSQEFVDMSDPEDLHLAAKVVQRVFSLCSTLIVAAGAGADDEPGAFQYSIPQAYSIYLRANEKLQMVHDKVVLLLKSDRLAPGEAESLVVTMKKIRGMSHVPQQIERFSELEKALDGVLATRTAAEVTFEDAEKITRLMREGATLGSDLVADVMKKYGAGDRADITFPLNCALASKKFIDHKVDKLQKLLQDSARVETERENAMLEAEKASAAVSNPGEPTRPAQILEMLTELDASIDGLIRMVRVAPVPTRLGWRQEMASRAGKSSMLGDELLEEVKEGRGTEDPGWFTEDTEKALSVKKVMDGKIVQLLKELEDLRTKEAQLATAPVTKPGSTELMRIINQLEAVEMAILDKLETTTTKPSARQDETEEAFELAKQATALLSELDEEIARLKMLEDPVNFKQSLDKTERVRTALWVILEKIKKRLEVEREEGLEEELEEELEEGETAPAPAPEPPAKPRETKADVLKRYAWAYTRLEPLDKWVEVEEGIMLRRQRNEQGQSQISVAFKAKRVEAATDRTTEGDLDRMAIKSLVDSPEQP